MLHGRAESTRIRALEKTVKTHAFPDGAKSVVPQNNLTPEQEKALELAKKNALIAEEKSKLIEHLKTIAQLQENLRQEQSKAAEMAQKAVGLEAKIKELSGQESNAKKMAELEAKVKELTEALGKISGIAAAGKAS